MDKTHAQSSSMTNVKVEFEGRLLHLSLPNDADSAADLAAALKARSLEFGIPQHQQHRLIANGAELAPHARLSALGEFFFRKNAVHMRILCAVACREWQRSGRCPKGSRCPSASTHNMHHSPRYVAHSHQPCSCLPASPPPSESLLSTPVCRHWAKAGHCNFGQGCHYAASHTVDNAPQGRHTVESDNNNRSAGSHPPATINNGLLRALPSLGETTSPGGQWVGERRHLSPHSASYTPTVLLSPPSPPAPAIPEMENGPHFQWQHHNLEAAEAIKRALGVH